MLANPGLSKAEPLWGSSICKLPLRPFFHLTRDEIKEAQHLWRCAPRNILTQGSLHYRLATLGYQKQNPYGVRLSHELPLRPLFLLKWLSKTEGYGVRQFANILCACSSFWNGYQKRKAMGFVSFTNSAKRLCWRLPSPWRGVGGEALMLRLYPKLGIFLWFSLLFHIFH